MVSAHCLVARTTDVAFARHLLAILLPDGVDPSAVAGALAALEAPFGCFLSTRMLTLL